MSTNEVSKESETSSSSGKTIWVGVLIVTVVLFSFFSLYWNHVLTYRGGSGLFISWSWLMNNGYLPYRDFFCHAPVLCLLRHSLLLSLFDNHYIIIRAWSVIERVAQGVLIYLVLSRLFTRKVAALPAIVSVIAGSGDRADGLDVYTQEALFFSVICIASAVSVLQKSATRSKLILLAMLSGIAAGCSFFTKQSIGLACVFVAPLVVSVALGRFDGWARARQFLFAYIGGLVLTTGAFGAWLGAHGILTEFVIQAFVTAPKAKASGAFDFVSRFVDRNISLYPFLITGLIGIALTWKKLFKTNEPDPTAAESERIVDWFPTVFVCAAALLTGALLGYNWGPASTILHLIGTVLSQSGMFFTYYGLFLVCVLYSVKWLRKSLSKWEAQAFVYASIGFADTFMVGLSYPFYEAILSPGLAFLLALIFDDLKGKSRALFLTFCFLIISFSVLQRLHWPYFFDSFFESPVSQANKPLTTPKMAGFVLPADMADFIDETTKIIQENSKPDDKIFVYPEGGIFYGLAERHCTTFCMGHNMDTVADSVLEEDAQVLLANPPKVLIFYRTTEKMMADLESVWRKGKPSGNRALMRACEELGKRYRLVKKFPFPNACLGGLEIEVYVRPDKMEPTAK